VADILVPHDAVTANATLKAIVERYGFLGLGKA
jgi:hypothetical protein